MGETLYTELWHGAAESSESGMWKIFLTLQRKQPGLAMMYEAPVLYRKIWHFCTPKKHNRVFKIETKDPSCTPEVSEKIAILSTLATSAVFFSATWYQAG